MTRPDGPGTINLTSGRRQGRLHQYPACGGRGSEGATPFLLTVLLSGHGLVRLARLDRSGLIRPGPVFDASMGTAGSPPSYIGPPSPEVYPSGFPALTGRWSAC